MAEGELTTSDMMQGTGVPTASVRLNIVQFFHMGTQFQGQQENKSVIARFSGTYLHRN